MKTINLIIVMMLFTCAAFAQGMYIEMKMTSDKLGDMGTMKTYSQDGNSRSEMTTSIEGVSHNMVSLILKSTPNVIYMLNNDAKTYTQMDVSSDNQWKDVSKDEYEVTVIGKEKVNGYNCTHAKVKRKDSKFDEDIWTSTEVIDYSLFMQAKTKFTSKDNLFKALSDKGVVGFPVRIKMNEREGNMQVDLVKAEKRNNPASLFSLSGYTKTESRYPTGAPRGPGSPDMQQMMEKMKNATPEERQKMIEEMKQKYQQQNTQQAPKN